MKTKYLLILGVELTPEGEKVQITKGEPTGCNSLGDVYGTGNAGVASWNMEYARNELRNETAKKGGNVVSLDSGTNTNGRVDLVGQAYKCP
jgi:hypothetical protein